MILFVLAVLLGVCALVAAGVGLINSEYRLASCGTAVGVGLVGVLAFVGSCMAIVSTKNVGIVTTFGRPTASLDNGLHWIAPWSSVTEMDETVQTDAHDQSGGSCINVRIAHQIISCVDVTVRWRLQESAAQQLFQNYRDFSNVRDSLVTRELATDLNSVLQAYDPLAVDENGNSISPALNTEAQSVQQEMSKQIGSQVEVLSVFIPVMHFDEATQSRINALQAQIAQTRIQTQAVKTAEQQAAANQALSSSVSTDANVLVSKCLDILSDMVTKGQTVPAGFSCWPGGGTGVVLPSK